MNFLDMKRFIFYHFCIYCVMLQGLFAQNLYKGEKTVIVDVAENESGRPVGKPNDADLELDVPGLPEIRRYWEPSTFYYIVDAAGINLKINGDIWADVKKDGSFTTGNNVDSQTYSGSFKGSVLGTGGTYSVNISLSFHLVDVANMTNLRTEPPLWEFDFRGVAKLSIEITSKSGQKVDLAPLFSNAPSARGMRVDFSNTKVWSMGMYIASDWLQGQADFGK